MCQHTSVWGSGNTLLNNNSIARFDFWAGAGEGKMFQKSMQIQGYDDELWSAIVAEECRQEEHMSLAGNSAERTPDENRAIKG